MHTDALRLALEALETGHDCAIESANRVHTELAGYKPHRHEAADRDIAQIAAAIEACRAALAAPAAVPVAWLWRNTKTDGRGVYFEDPAKFFDMAHAGDYEWTALYAGAAPAAVPVAHVDLIERLLKIATDETPHDRMGGCPDAVEGYTVRDPECAACRAVLEAESLLAGAAPAAPAAVPVAECNDNDSPWLICKTCVAAGRCDRAAPAAPSVPAGWVDSVMEQAQVFASAWSLVGGRFDNGNMLEEANAAKAELRAMLAAAPTDGGQQHG